MEVHHHTQTPRKKWSHYFWEFFMLFLAVFCGFLAENRRESIVEKRREKEYIGSLIEDIRLDNHELHSSITLHSSVIQRIDSLFEIFKSGDWRKRTSDIYFIIRRSTRTTNFYYHDRTIQQLKNSGGLRLIHNIHISNEIIKYDAEVRKLLSLQERVDDSRGKIRENATIIFDPLVLYDMVKETSDDFEISKPSGNPPIKKPELLQETLGELHYLRNISVATSRLQQKIINYGNDLATLLANEYNLKKD